MRKQGYYWVKYKSKWAIAYFDQMMKAWYLPAMFCDFYDDDVDEIGKNRIIRKQEVKTVTWFTVLFCWGCIITSSKRNRVNNMKIRPAIRTEQEIDKIAAGLQGTWVRRRNARNTMIKWSNELVMQEIEKVKSEIRKLRVNGVKEWDLSYKYAEITALELMII